MTFERWNTSNEEIVEESLSTRSESGASKDKNKKRRAYLSSEWGCPGNKANLAPPGSCPVLTDFTNCTLIIGSTFTTQIEPCITTCRNPTKDTLMSHAKVQRVRSFLEQT